MKIWIGYGSEHSMNLVMIGHFKDVTAAETALDTIKAATEAVQEELDAGRLVMGEPGDRFTDEMLKAVGDLRLHSIGARELEQLLYDVKVERRGDQIVLKTDEVEVQVFVKLLLSQGARIEMYSAHDHPDGAESA
ncbi:MAG: DUF6375 family protein [Streptosporangiaceae bacterium]